MPTKKPALRDVMPFLEIHWADNYKTEAIEVEAGQRKYILHPRVFNGVGSNAARVFMNGMKVPDGATVLDMGCGFGLLGIEALHRGAGHAVLVDNSADAVANAKANLELHNFQERGEALVSDLFSAVAGRSFDVVLFNGPFIAIGKEEFQDTVKPDSNIYGDASPGVGSYFDPGYVLFERFFSEVGKYLKPGGRILFGFGNMGDEARLETFLNNNELAIHSELLRINADDDGGGVFYLLSIGRREEQPSS